MPNAARAKPAITSVNGSGTTAVPTIVPEKASMIIAPSRLISDCAKTGIVSVSIPPADVSLPPESSIQRGGAHGAERSDDRLAKHEYVHIGCRGNEAQTQLAGVEAVAGQRDRRAGRVAHQAASGHHGSPAGPRPANTARNQRQQTVLSRRLPG